MTPDLTDCENIDGLEGMACLGMAFLNAAPTEDPVPAAMLVNNSRFSLI